MPVVIHRQSLCIVCAALSAIHDTPHSSTCHRLTLQLQLSLAGVERNPGLPTSLILGSFNAGGANKGAQIADMIRDHNLDLLAISETKMNANTTNAVMLDLAPPGRGVLHVHRSRITNRPTHGLTFIFSLKLLVRP